MLGLDERDMRRVVQRGKLLVIGIVRGCFRKSSAAEGGGVRPRKVLLRREREIISNSGGVNIIGRATCENSYRLGGENILPWEETPSSSVVSYDAETGFPPRGCANPCVREDILLLKPRKPRAKILRNFTFRRPRRKPSGCILFGIMFLLADNNSNQNHDNDLSTGNFSPRRSSSPKLNNTILPTSSILVAEAAPIAVCPSKQQFSGFPCTRCLSDEFCPQVQGLQWLCHPMHKLCMKPTCMPPAVCDDCGTDIGTAIGLSAECQKLCPDERPPFSCASNCLNGDYPCRWIPDCQPPGNMEWYNYMCIRGCQDRDKKVQSLNKGDDCASTVANGIDFVICH